MNVGVGVIRIELNGGPVMVDRLVWLPGIVQNFGKIALSGRVERVELKGFAKEDDRFVQVFLVLQTLRRDYCMRRCSLGLAREPDDDRRWPPMSFPRCAGRPPGCPMPGWLRAHA